MDKEKVFRDAVRLYKWFITKSYIDVYQKFGNEISQIFDNGNENAARAKQLFFQEGRDKEFVKQIKSLYEEYVGEGK